MGKRNLSDSDYRLMNLVWEYGPIRSGELVKLCAERNRWEKSTTYTMIKKLSQKGFLENQNSVVKPLIPKSDVQKCESRRVLQKIFDNSLPRFVSAFLNDGNLSRKEADEIIQMLRQYQE